MIYDPNRLRILNEDDFLDTVDMMNTQISTFVENYIYDKGKIPDLDDFIETYPAYDNEILYPSITTHINKIVELVQKETANEQGI
jgi:hypothetical protein